MKELNILNMMEVRNFEVFRDYFWFLAIYILENRVWN